MKILNPSDVHPKRLSQLQSSIVSTPSAPAAPESLYATHITSSSVKLGVNVLGTSTYSSKEVNVVFSMWGGGGLSRFFYQRNSATGSPILVQRLSGMRQPPPSTLVTWRTAFRSFLDSNVL